jgi:HECT-domain (ubiquitin-transferase)
MRTSNSMIDPLEVMLDFTIEKDGEHHDLKENGSNVIVTNENKYEYMDLA